MFRNGVLLLHVLIGALVAHADANAAVTTPTSYRTTTDDQRLVRSTTATLPGATATRQLRVHKSTYDGEERGITVPGLETVVNSVKSTVSAEKLQEWLKKGESTDDVFKLLVLDDAADDLLANPNLNAWINYIKLFNEENPTKKASLIATLTTHYGDDGLAKIIEAAKRVPSTEDIAKRIQTEQLQTWLVNKKTTNDVFGLLALDKAGDDLLANPLLNTWISYMKLYNENNPTKKTSLIATLTAHYGDDGVANIVEAGKRIPRASPIAKRVQTEQIQRWLVDGKSPDDVFALLKLDKAGSGLFTQPQVNTWVKYMDDFKKANPNDEMTLFSALSKRYNEETLVQMLMAAKKVPSTESVAVRIQGEQTKYWLSEDVKKTPAEVLELLHLDNQGVALFSNPLFTAWIKYTDEFNKIYYGERLTAISALKKLYEVDAFSKMVLEAMKNPRTASLAKRME
ncbi:putative secreted RxLR effector protein [Phytophthora cinnamomi]|uniref:putative secreted RxLR effector protein n=1 Tax=Phytophthora cinnamomi TaxID=4785 RepID=UPI003559B641|nr:putative secreted RxLR effector protein [Phytophthora cinnamomi]